MKQKFKKGDFVVLKSGGQVMTIVNDREDGMDSFGGIYICSGYEKKKEYNKKFPQEELKLIS
jgi:uncharacterized protein YodC (DUF2158 family)